MDKQNVCIIFSPRFPSATSMYNEAAYLVPGYLSDQGITSEVAPLPTRRKALWSEGSFVRFSVATAEAAAHLPEEEMGIRDE